MQTQSSERKVQSALCFVLVVSCSVVTVLQWKWWRCGLLTPSPSVSERPLAVKQVNVPSQQSATSVCFVYPPCMLL